MKNLNSFRFLQKALEYEIARQIDVLLEGGRVMQETRLFDSSTGQTVSMRSKEEAHDYRYFPDPDLPAVVVDAARVEAIRAQMPELPAARRERFVGSYGLPEYDAGQLTQTRALSDFFEAAVRAGAAPKAVSNWMMGELARLLKESARDIAASPVSPGQLAGLIALIDKGTISGAIAKGVFEKMMASGRSADAIVAAEGLTQIDDESQIVALIAGVLAKNADAVARIPRGEDGDLRVPRRAGDEGGSREGESETRERPAETRARNDLRRRDRSLPPLQGLQPRRLCAARPDAHDRQRASSCS